MCKLPELERVLYDREVECLRTPAQALCPWDFPGKDTEVGCHALLQEIFPTQGLNPHLLCLLNWQVGPLPLAPPEKHYSFIG